jgi:hypothetical protein
MKIFFTSILLLLPLGQPATLWAQTSAHKPAVAAPAPLPDIPTLLHQVELAQQQNEKIRQNYFYDATTTTLESNGHTDVKVAEIFFVNGVRLERLLSHNGKPLPPEDAAKEKERIDKAVAKAKERVAKAESKGELTDANGNEMISLDRILQLFTITNERRETVNGRSAIAFDFAGTPGVKTHSMPETALHTFSGTAWIDEKDHALARMTGVTRDGYRVGLGMIVNVSKGLSGTIECAPVNGEVWMPMRIEGQGHIRVLLLDDALDGKETTVFSNFHKFTTDVKVMPSMDASSGANAPGASDKPKP